MERNSDNQLPLSRRLAYGVGHILNDLCASMWFTYMLLYMRNVVGMSAVNAGIIILIGQVADALATPFVGLESDRTVGVKYGRRKIWHLVGVIFVVCSFPFIFNKCIHCASAPEYAQMVYYAPFIVMFQFGWAATQISHLALIPELTTSNKEKMELNAIRYFFTIASNLVVYITCFLVFELHNSNAGKGLPTISAADTVKFQILALSVVGLGVVFMIIFHVFVRERRPQPSSHEERESLINPASDDAEDHPLTRSTTSVQSMSIRGASCWLKQRVFYQVGALYMATRLIVNVSQIYTPLYVINTLQLSAHAIAIVPGIVFVSGIPAALLSKRMTSKIGLKGSFFVGLLCIFASSTWLYLIAQEITDQPPKYGMQAYGCAVFLGFGGSTLLITALGMIAGMIGKYVDTGAFVYGSMSFLDKLSNGAAVMIIQSFHPCKNSIIVCHNSKIFLRTIMVFVPGFAAVFALIVLLTVLGTPIGTQSEDSVKNCKESAYGSVEPINPSSEAVTSTG